MEEMRKKAIVHRDEENKIIVENGLITCYCEDGLNFHIEERFVDSNSGILRCTNDEYEIDVDLQSNTFAVQEQVTTAQVNACVDDSAIQQSHFAWDDKSTKLFLALYKEKRNFVTLRKIKNLRQMWQVISEGMQREGYNVTTTQVENKFKSLERGYKNMKSNNSKTGRGRLTCSYESELNDILGNRHSINPVALADRGKLIQPRNVASSTATAAVPLEGVEMPEDDAIQVEGIAEVHGQEPIEMPVPQATTSSGPTRRYAPGTTAKALEKCCETMNTLIGMEEERKKFRADFLQEFREFRQTTAEHQAAVLKQREEKINLLREVLDTMKQYAKK